jgi:hypothetical protein
VIFEVNHLDVEGGCPRMKKGSAFATDAKAIFHGSITGDGDEREAIPPILVIEIAKVSQIEVIQPVESDRITGSNSQEHLFSGGSLRNGQINVP